MLNRPGIFFHLQRILSGNYSRVRRILGNEIQLQKNQTVLDLACGTGNIADSFDSVNYIGVDINDDYIRFAKERYKKEFLVSDVRQLCFTSESFDWVVAVGLFHHLSDADTLSTIRGVSRILRRDGQMVIIDAVFPVSRFNIPAEILRRLDRGEYIRSIDQYRALFNQHFRVKKAYLSRGWLFDYCVFVLDQMPNKQKGHQPEES